jgi:hypothetical protein
VARSAEGDWYEAQRRSIEQVRRLQKKYNGIPIILAGDLTHNWNEPAQLVNFLMDQLPPNFYAIPGQHDLAYHRSRDLSKTVFYTLMKAGRVRLIPRNPFVLDKNIVTHGFPWGTEVEPLDRKHQMILPKHVQLAVAHTYIWASKSTSYTGAPKDKYVGVFGKRFKGYDAAVVGDNHINFIFYTNNPKAVLNSGSLMCRNSDQIDYIPSVGLLYKDGDIERYHLDTSKDKWIDSGDIEAIAKRKDIDLTGLVSEFKNLDTDTIDFVGLLERAMRIQKLPQVRKVLEGIIGEYKK